MSDPYTQLIRPLLFSGLKLDPEWLHRSTLTSLVWLAQPGPSSWSHQRQNWLRHQLTVEDERLQQTLWGLTFANPLGLAAGFDKDGAAARAWPLFGFGFAELGTVTCHAQPGNPQPRLFRLTEDQAVLNRMGFNNQGAAAMTAYLADLWPDGRSPIPIGINLGKSKITPLEEAAQDYLTSFKQLQPWGDYFVVNVSSPNTPGLRDLQATDQLAPILQALQQANTEQKPLLVKIAPDLEWDEIAAVVDLAQRYQLAGIIATNTTIRKDHLKTQLLPSTGRPLTEEAGGISGAPLRSRSTEVIRFIWKETQGQLPIVGVGGIFTAADAWEKLTAGASLLQTYTGWIYEGPWMVRRVLEGLLVQLEAHGLSSLQAAVGLADEI
ncbi:quinone-dependent dihydroorotate dehydrogenase [Pseudanabaena sp. FACHB-2040]|uniref:quinone-dependent dihydroorotate dehydrogenase n=1 Tax=Pseudanabaena sp. FACHB-2040 TaxID=2692859 RepID=UPI001688AF7D|nr:quinone-dependent dihydroorotate dehydrogenase [Pseudanabaena sp. FACHB-2040]MBD2256157.1 quinone-dependent dihydroorotate dehydrogenase [Pseudanabaena sp. FACHB-2040]